MFKVGSSVLTGAETLETYSSSFGSLLFDQHFLRGRCPYVHAVGRTEGLHEHDVELWILGGQHVCVGEFGRSVGRLCHGSESPESSDCLRDIVFHYSFAGLRCLLLLPFPMLPFRC